MTKTPPAQQVGWDVTPFQLRVLELLSHGLTRDEVAEFLRVSLDTVKTHVQRLYRRLGAANAAHAVRLGFERGLLTAGTDDAVRRAASISVPETELEDEGEGVDA